nr:group II intron maturase-specific domain-containing protein [Sulfobacillus harzensis]
MVIDGLAPVVRGWGHYFAISPAWALFDQLDAWTRERCGPLSVNGGIVVPFWTLNGPFVG